MTDKIPGTKFIIFSLICMVAAGYIAAVSGNIAFDRIVPSVLPFLDTGRHYEAQLEEAAGLVVGDDVRVAGVDVGRVNSIRLEEGLAVVSFEVSDDVEPTTAWKVGARWRNAIGQRFLYLYPQTGGVVLPEDSTIPVTQSVPVADLAAFVNQITPLLQAIDPESQNKLTRALNEVLLGREDDIQNLVVNLSELADTVSAEEPEIRAVIANANLLLSEYNSREQQLTGFIDQLSSVSSTLATRNGELFDAANDITEVQSQLGRLIEANDDNIADSLNNLRLLTNEIGEDRVAFEDALASTRQGLATYMLTSRRGQWFNVRAVAIQVQQGGDVTFCQTESGTDCSFPNDPRAGTSEEEQPPTSTGTTTGTPEIPGADVSVAPERLNALEVVFGVPLTEVSERTLALAGEGDR